MRRYHWWWVGGMATLFALIIGGLQWWKYQQFGYNGLDLGIYTQTVWALSHGLGFLSSIHDPIYLGDHLELGLIPLAGLYRFLPSPLTLLWAQTIIIAISAWPLYQIAKRLLSDRLALVAAGLWLAHPLIYNAAIYEFHGLVFALPLLLWGIWAYLERRLGWWLVSLALLALVREDLPLVIAGWALLAAFDRRGWRWWGPAAVIAIGWFLAAQSIITHAQPLGSYKYLAFYGWLGGSYSEILTYPFRHPIIFIQHLFSAHNFLTLATFLLTFGFLPILRPRRLLPIGLVLFQLFFSGARFESILRIHYVLPYLPFLAWASLTVIHDVREKRLFTRWPTGAGMIVVGIIAVAAPLYSHLAFGPADIMWRGKMEAQLTAPAILHWAVTQVPADSSVLTTFNLIPALGNRSEIYSLNYVQLGRRQYSNTPYRLPGQIDVAVIDWQQYYDYQYLYKDTLFENQTGIERLASLLEKYNLTLSTWIDGVAIYKRDGRDYYQPVEYRGASDATISGELEPLGQPKITKILVPTALVGWRQYEISMNWAVQENFDHPLSIRFLVKQHNRAVWTSTRILGQGMMPAETWAKTDRWQTRYRLALPPQISGLFELTAEVYRLDGRLRLDSWGSFAPVISERELLAKVSSNQVD